MMGDTIIEREPDKMIVYVNGIIMLAYRDLIIYCNIRSHGIDDVEKKPLDAQS